MCTSYNIAYLAPGLRYYAQITLRGTSDTLRTLYATHGLEIIWEVKSHGKNDNRLK